MNSDNPEGVSVHAGFPNPGTDRSLQALNLNTLLIAHSASTYFMQIAGNDWRGIGVFNGDIAIVDRAISASPNDLMVWIYEDSLALSPRHRVPDGASVFGVVTATIHQFKKVNR